MPVLVCTTVTRRTLAWARRLDESLRRCSPGARLMTLLLDDRELAIDHTRERFELVRPARLELERFELLAARLPETRLIRAAQASLMRLALERADGAPTVYLHPQTEVFADLGGLGALADEHGFALVPRLTEPIPRDGLTPTDIDALQAGIFDPGCLACGGGERALRLLRAWTEGVRHAELHQAWAVHSRWHDLLATFAPQAEIVGDPGIGVSIWNLHERRLGEEDGRLLVNGEPLRTLCFAGLETAPDATVEADRMLTRGQALLQRGPLLARLVAARAGSIGAWGPPQGGAEDYGFARLADGTPLSSRLREWIRLAERHGGLRRSPFSAEGTAELFAWLRTPTPLGAAHGIPRLWLTIYAERLDLQSSFPDLDGPGGQGFARWIRDTGERDYELPAALRITSGATQAG